MDQSAAATTYLLYVVTLWLGTLTWVWSRHLREDEKKALELREKLMHQDERLERVIGRMDAALSAMQQYQTNFNLEIARDIAEIKQAIRQGFEGRP